MAKELSHQGLAAVDGRAAGPTPTVWMSGPGRREWIPLALLLLAVAAVHVGSLRKPFFADDYFFLEQVRGRSLTAALASPDPLGNFFRPVSRQIHFWVLSAIGRESPLPFHAANLALFLSSLGLLYLLLRRLTGRAPALVAVAFVGFHYAADVPVQWASGSQDLLALFFACAAILLHVRGQSRWAALALFLGLLSKETVAGAAVVALVAASTPGRPWRDSLRHSMPLLVVTALWAGWWAATLPSRPATEASLALSPGALFAAPIHLVQVATAWEFRQGGSSIGHWSIAALLVALLAAALLWLGFGREGGREESSPEGRTWLWTGLTWVGVGVLPLVPVMPIWSAYYYLFGLFGVAVLMAGLCAKWSPQVQIAVAAVLVLFSANARQLDEFSTTRNVWTWQSHVNRRYIDRAHQTIARYLRQIKTARPTLPHRSTVFFANVSPSSGWQSGNGPLLRWAYRDSSLRSYYMTEFTRARSERGPFFFFAADGDSLQDKSDDPMLLPSFAHSALLAEHPATAIEALQVALVGNPGDRVLLYWRGLAELGVGDSTLALRDFTDAGLGLGRHLNESRRYQLTAPIADTTSRIRELLQERDSHVLDPWIHARLAALCLASEQWRNDGVIEAYAYRVLSPNDADAWRKWASAQLGVQQYQPALESLERYLALRHGSGRPDPEAEQVAASLRRVVYGDIAHQALQDGRQGPRENGPR